MRTPRIIIAGLATLGLSLAAIPAAQASVTYGQIAVLGANEQEVVGAVGVAVDQTSGNVYVGRMRYNGVDEYDAAGSHIATFDETNGLLSGVAVDPVNGNVYVVDGVTQALETFSSSGQFISEFSIAGSGNILGDNYTAVQIASDSAGNVYLPDAPHNEVQEFNPAGNVLATFTGSGAEALKEPTGIAVDPSGNVYVADNGNGRVEEFSPSGAFIMALGTGVNQTTGGSVCTAVSGDTCGPGSDGSQAVALDSAGDIFVGENNGAGFHVVLYSPTGEKLSDFGLGTIGTSPLGSINSLAVAPSGLVYVTDGGNNVVRIYAPQSKPSVVSVSAVAVNRTTATLEATIGAGKAETSYRFEYGTSTAYGASVPVPEANIGDGPEGPVTVGQELSGLQAGTTYHYRVVASNAVGEAIGSDQRFTTLPPAPPVVVTGQAVGVAQNSATLTGTIETGGVETVYEFDMGVDTSYGTRIFGDAGVEPGTNTYTFPLQGLKPNTTYHFRIVATNAFGTIYGVDQTFTTASYPSSVLASPETPSLLPTPLLAPAGSAPSTIANASTAGRSFAHSARHRKALESARERGRPGLKDRSSRPGRAHDDNRGGGR
jgi:sugar lactone lactonase YvrE